MIILKNIEKTFTKNGQIVHALKNIHLEIPDGSIFGFIGYSGAGKSTLIRLINQLEEPSSGEIFIRNVDITRLDKKQQRLHRKKIGMIFQHFNLLNSKTVAENIALPLVLSKHNKHNIDSRVEEILAFVELSDKKNAYPNQLSGGQKQRVGIARALINNPEILLCDEATSALDPQTTASILDLLKKINREQNITILLVTHEMSVIERVCNHVAVMENGQIIEVGTKLNIFRNPQTKTTKKFIGSIITKNLPQGITHGLKNTENIYRLEFLAAPSQQSIINELIINNSIKINILFANMREIDNLILGSIFVQLFGNDMNIANTIQWLQQQGVVVEHKGDLYV